MRKKQHRVEEQIIWLRWSLKWANMIGLLRSVRSAKFSLFIQRTVITAVKLKHNFRKKCQIIFIFVITTNKIKLDY